MSIFKPLEPRNRDGGIIGPVLFWGALWGVFEATVGYLLHLLPISIGFLVWFPIACFFMGKVYARTGKARAILYVGLLSAAVKLVDLLLPGRIDRVINPAVSIIFESLALFAVVCILNTLQENRRANPATKALAAVGINTLWRGLFILYIAFIVPQWMRDVSVMRSAPSLVRFAVIDHAASSAVLWLFYQYGHLFAPLGGAIKKSAGSAALFTRSAAFKAVAIALLLLLDVALQLAL